ncbi:Hydantoinase/oxoprolinase family protein [Olavius sp. associated proteobacterium Delta 1]|nr:Hydantoinase/oxoprolinase family protein [Olavius sp. associated proteobacterium Delta 1]
MNQSSQNRKPYLIACAVLGIDIKAVAEKLGSDIGTRYLEGGLHDRPHLLREKLQAAIDEISASGRCERIMVGYGVCGRGTVGIQARDIPLAIPKVHDCMALFLGGDREYQRQFKKYPGTYYISAGWYEEKTEPFSQQKKTVFLGDQKLSYDELVDKYGENAAQETYRFLSTWKQNYHRAAFIETGVKRSPEYENFAREMAREYGWQYEKIPGDHALIEKLLSARETNDEILVVPPNHVIQFDSLESRLSAKPLWDKKQTRQPGPEITVLDDEGLQVDAAVYLKIGLGIDAGGTYTDTVLYDFEQGRTICKNKALTTKWDFTVGIHQALTGLDLQKLPQVEMVSLSTTLATNAIVEGEGQKVGMIIMPPYGRFDADDIPYEPKAAITGQLEISGTEITPLDEAQVKNIVRRMVKDDDVKAFAVSGYAGAINPAHELAVKRIIRQETGLFVTCGHELSDTLNFRTRAHTAMLNARIIPKLTKLLKDLERVLANLGITAPVVVVKGDGTLMDAAMARERPVETILSGPAASVAGARHLTGLKNALVVDMGGTTTDTAALRDGAVSVCQTGSNVGGHKTHVKALEIRTAGLGGDSLIQREKGQFLIGPQRVAPIAWLGAECAGTDKAIEYLNRRKDRFKASTRGMQILALTGSLDRLSLTPSEEKIVTLLNDRPFSIQELCERTGVLIEWGLKINRLEDNFVIQRCGLTLTDLLHVTGRFVQWDRHAAANFCRLFSHLVKMDIPEMAEHLLGMGIERLALELLKRQLDEETDPDALDTCPICKTLVKNLFSNGNDQYAVRIDLKRPVVGIGAPIHFFLPQAAQTLGADAVLPQNADVANAIGAVTSDVVVKRQAVIVPGQGGGFVIRGMVGARQFGKFDEADAFVRRELIRMVRDQARAAGTSSRAVKLKIDDRIPNTADGSPIFIARTIQAKLKGRPDLVLNRIPNRSRADAN